MKSVKSGVRRTGTGREFRFHGTVEVPEGWRRREEGRTGNSVWLRFRGSGEGNGGTDERVELPVPPGGGPVPFRSERLPPGRYAVEAGDWILKDAWGLPPEGREVRLALPEPVPVQVRVTDEESAEEIPGARVCLDGGAGAWRAEVREDPPPEGGPVVFPCIPGEYRLSAEALGYFQQGNCPCDAGEIVVIPPRRPAFLVVSLRRSAVLVARAFHRDLPLGGSASVSWQRLETDEGGGARKPPIPGMEGGWSGGGWGLERGVAVVDDLEGGTYAVELLPPPGFAAPDPVLVHLRRGLVTEVRLDAERAGSL